jgi:hypothetical protein
MIHEGTVVFEVRVDSEHKFIRVKEWLTSTVASKELLCAELVIVICFEACL